MASPAGGPVSAPPVAPSFPAPAVPAARASAPVSAPPVVPAPALPNWPPPTNPSAGGSGPYPPATPAARPTYQGGRDLAGTAYGGTDGPGFATVSLPQNNPVENSGSLTGHILAQGWAEDAPSTRSSNTRVVIVLAVALGLLIAISLLVVFLANDAMSGITSNMLDK